VNTSRAAARISERRAALRRRGSLSRAADDSRIESDSGISSITPQERTTHRTSWHGSRPSASLLHRTLTRQVNYSTLMNAIQYLRFGTAQS